MKKPVAINITRIDKKFVSAISFGLILIVSTFTASGKICAAETININGSQVGRTFEGIGGLSAGASSRLLIDYPQPYKSQVLDYLFKPNYGAALHHLKVEIGGGINSTDGTEPSHAYTRVEFENPKPEYYERGYEWWLMKEAKKRNPDIYLDCLEWGAPGWIGGGQFYSQDNADYIVAFIKAAMKYHNLKIDYTGIWNEKRYKTAWIKTLRRTLDDNNLESVKIVAADQREHRRWKIVYDMNADEDLKNAIYAVGDHYLDCNSPDTAKRIGKPLWEAEGGPWRGDWQGACKLAKIYNRNYIRGRITKTIIWSLVTAYYENLPLPNSGIMKANTPWSGFYDVQPAVWATAHTTQFAQPGWKYIDSGCGELAGGGSFVTLRKSSRSGDYSIIIETIDASEKQEITFGLTKDFSAGKLAVWRTNKDRQFARLSDITPIDGSFTITLEAGSIYSLTTTTGQQKGEARVPPASVFPLPYKDDFESYSVGKMPKYFSDQGGIFEVANRTCGSGKCLRQILTQRGIEFRRNSCVETFLGDTNWKDYEVSSDVYIEDSGFVSIFGRVTEVYPGKPTKGYWLKVGHSGDWHLKAGAKTISSGIVPFSADAWHNLKLKFVGSNITTFLDDVRIASVSDTEYSCGLAGVGSGWNRAQFNNFAVKPISPDLPGK